MPKLKLPYYTFLHSQIPEEARHRNFYDSSEFEWTKNVEANFEIIQKEFAIFLEKESHQLQSYFASEMVNSPNKWKTIGFYFWGLRDEKNCESCNESFKIFDKIPGLVSVSLSLMEPDSVIKGHYGDTDAIYRCHLPLVAPGKLPEIGFQVGKEQQSWERGKLMIFNDAAYHTGWNKTNERRIVLMLDIIKKEYLPQKIWICSMVLSSLALKKNYNISSENKKSIFYKSFLYVYALYVWFYFSLINPRSFRYKPTNSVKSK